MDSTTSILIVILILVIMYGVCKNKKEGYRANYDDSRIEKCSCSGAVPWSVVPPAWIGSYDQGNGLMGDDILSGMTFSPAY